MTTNRQIVNAYFEAVAKGDFDTVDNLLIDYIIWHQPGKGIQSGIYQGKAQLFAHLGRFMQWSNGTFAIDAIDYTADNGDLVVASIHFKAEKGDHTLAMKGVDVLRIDNQKIKEVWLFSEDIEEEDRFWNWAAV